jgi:hypothetical protein
MGKFLWQTNYDIGRYTIGIAIVGEWRDCF